MTLLENEGEFKDTLLNRSAALVGRPRRGRGGQDESIDTPDITRFCHFALPPVSFGASIKRTVSRNVSTPSSSAKADCPPDTAGVIAHPPIIYFWAIVAGIALRYVWPLPVGKFGFIPPIGIALMVLAVVLFVWAVSQFPKVGTPIPTNRPTTALVKTGPYRWGRNPIYVSFTLLHLGLALCTNNAWLLVTLVPAVLLIRFGVIAREERYLERRLGKEYSEYTRTVRRWI